MGSFTDTSLYNSSAKTNFSTSIIMKHILNIALLVFSLPLFAQKKQEVKLYDLLQQQKTAAVNRTITAIDSLSFDYIKISENKGEGIIWLPVKDFKNGTIKVTMRGQDVFQRSFIGIAFHGQNDTTYDAVYCRPFNFFAKDSIRKIHAIQYISHPNYTWEKLRTERNGIYEKAITNPPNPNGWFTLTLKISHKTIEAYINKEKTPSLKVVKISDFNSGKIGIFVADRSGGDFRSANIEYSK